MTAIAGGTCNNQLKISAKEAAAAAKVTDSGDDCDNSDNCT